jgi:hypothetical protein
MHYDYIRDGDSYYFATSQSLYYKVSITHTSDYLINEISNSNDLYTISFAEISRTELPAHDAKVYSTISYIIRNWFSQNNKILYYICSNADGRAENRFRLFCRWFKYCEQHAPEQFCYNHLIKQLDLDEENCYVGFIYRDDYPQRDFIENEFEESVNNLQYK